MNELVNNMDERVTDEGIRMRIMHTDSAATMSFYELVASKDGEQIGHIIFQRDRVPIKQQPSNTRVVRWEFNPAYTGNGLGAEALQHAHEKFNGLHWNLHQPATLKDHDYMYALRTLRELRAAGLLERVDIKHARTDGKQYRYFEYRTNF